MTRTVHGIRGVTFGVAAPRSSSMPPLPATLRFLDSSTFAAHTGERPIAILMSHSRSEQTQGTVTRLLQELCAGRQEAFDELVPHVYDELRRLAHQARFGEREGHTLTTTALVHEAYLKLANEREMHWECRAHFLAVAAQAMRRILISYARRRKAAKREGARTRIALDEAFGIADDNRVNELLWLDEALGRLEAVNPRHSEIVQCRFFGGLTIEETAEALGIAPITVTRDWRMARAWLKHELDPIA